MQLVPNKYNFELSTQTTDSEITLQLCKLMNHNIWNNAYY